MNIYILGDDLVAWTLAGALSSTGCNIFMQASQLPQGHHEATESELFLLLYQQHKAGRILLNAALNSGYTKPIDLLIDSREHQSLESIINAVKQANFPAVVALVHTVAIGTTDALQQHLVQQQSHTAVVYWPNFIQAGRALSSFTRVEQVLLGSDHSNAKALIKHLMLPFNRSHDRFYEVTAREAELAKIAINGMLATRISYMNELSKLAEATGIDIESIRKCMGRDSRIGFQYLYPGCGFAGNALTDSLHQLNQELEKVNEHDQGLLSGVLRINDQQKDQLFQKFWRFYKANIRQKSVAIWGVAYKPNTASVAGSPALHLIQTLLEQGVKVRVYDPMAMSGLKQYFGEADGLFYAENAFDAVEQADALMLITEWKEFWNIDLARAKSLMKTSLMLDGRNIYDPKLLVSQGWIYSGIGRGQKV